MNGQDQQADPVVTLSVPLSAINYALSVAGDRPYKESAPFIEMLRGQAAAWIKANEVKSAAASPSDDIPE